MHKYIKFKDGEKEEFHDVWRVNQISLKQFAWHCGNLHCFVQYYYIIH